jgi:hypothetical protein
VKNAQTDSEWKKLQREITATFATFTTLLDILCTQGYLYVLYSASVCDNGGDATKVAT